MGKTLISSIYDHNSVMLCATRFSVDTIFLITDNKPNETQKKAIEIVKSSLGKVVKIYEKKANAYDICGTAKIVVDLLDSIDEEQEVVINVTAGRKTQSMGLTFGSYARSSKVTAIVYVTEEEKDIIYLPKLNYDITDSQRAMLELIAIDGVKNINTLSERLEFSKGITYRNFETLKKKGMLIKDNDGLSLTDYGKLVLM